MVKAHATVKTDDGKIVILVSAEAFGLIEAITKIKDRINGELEYWFEEDHWQTAEITITRS